MKSRVQMAKIFLKCDLTEEAGKALDEADEVREYFFESVPHYKGHILKRRGAVQIYTHSLEDAENTFFLAHSAFPTGSAHALKVLGKSADASAEGGLA